MPLSPDRLAAHEQLDAAVTALVEAHNTFEPSAMVSGYTLIVSAVGFDDDPEADEQDTVSHTCSFVKRGQSPHLTRGMTESLIDQFRSAE